MATQVTPTVVQTAGENGACREFWVKMTGLVGLDLNAGAATVVNTVENPFNEDMLIWEALIIVTTGSGAVNPDFDIGLGSSATGGGGVELADGLSSTQLNVTGPYELSLVKAIAGPPLKPLWKAPNAAGTATDSWLVFDQNGTVTADDLRYTCLVKVIPQVDLD